MEEIEFNFCNTVCQLFGKTINAIFVGYFTKFYFLIAIIKMLKNSNLFAFPFGGVIAVAENV